MNSILDRIFAHWKTSASGLLAVAGIVFLSLNQTYPGRRWVALGISIVAGLNGLMAKDK